MEMESKATPVNYDRFYDSARMQEERELRTYRQRVINSVLLIGFLVASTVVIVYSINGSQLPDIPKNLPLMFCYYTYDPNSEVPGPTPESVNATLCTHLIFGFAGITNHTLYPREKDANTTFSVWKRVVKLKENHPHLKVMLSVGATKEDFSNTCFSNDTLQTFVQSAVDVIKKFNFDGLDIDWEFPSWDGMPYEDKDNYISLLKSLREAFDSRSGQFLSPNRIILTSAVAAPFTITEVSYDVPNMVEYLDYCLMMGYDFSRYNPLFPVAEFNSPLHRHNGQIAFLSYLNLVWSANRWIDKGMPRDKFVVGVPFYGVTFKLVKNDMNDVGSPVKGPGIFNGESSYPIMCDLIENQNWTTVFHNDSRVPYAYFEDNWITYENVQSIKEKVSWILDSNFAGVMTFDLNQDDYNKSCASSEENFPLQSTVYQLVQEKIAKLEEQYPYIFK